MILQPTRTRQGVTLVMLAALVTASAGCRDDVAPPVAPRTGTAPTTLQGTQSAPPRQGSGGTHEPALTPEERERRRSLDEAMERTEEMRRDYDRQARALIERFRDVAYDPVRDGGLKGASGLIDVDVDGHKGRYRFAFDASIQDAKKQVTLTTVHEDAGIHPESARQARRFAVLAARGPYSSVISYAPPVQWHVVQGHDNHMIAVAPPHRSALGVSYRMDPRGFVEMRGRTTGKAATRTTFEWKADGDLWLLAKEVDVGDLSAVEYEYAEEKGITALRTAKLTEGTHTFAATVTWERIETR